MSNGQVQSMEPFPVQTRVATTGKSGISIVLHSYSNRYFILINEANSYSVGTVIQVIKHQQSSGFDVGPASTVFDISVRFGNENPELLLASRILASKVDFDKPILFGLALRSCSKDVIEEVVEELQKLLKSTSN